MSIGGVTETAIMQLIFNAVGWGGYADNASISPQTNISVALHTSDPGSAGDQTTNEANYTSYARVPVSRDVTGWSVTGTNPSSCSPVNPITFPTVTGGSGNGTFFSVGENGGGTTPILFSGTVTPAASVSMGITPQLTQSTVIALT